MEGDSTYDESRPDRFIRLWSNRLPLHTQALWSCQSHPDANLSHMNIGLYIVSNGNVIVAVVTIEYDYD